MNGSDGLPPEAVQNLSALIAMRRLNIPPVLPTERDNFNSAKPISAGVAASRGWLVQWLVPGLLAASCCFVLFWCDPNQYSFYPVCAFHRATGLLCPGCGSLRAIHQLLHGHLTTAFRFNPLLISSLPFLLVYAAKSCLGSGYGRRFNFASGTKWWWVILVTALVFTLWRNFPGSVFSIPQ